MIVKHNNPCGAALGGGAAGGLRAAFASDPLSAFGGVIGFNRRVDRETAEALAEQFVEVLFAPGYEDGALEILPRKPDVRILEDKERRAPLLAEPDIRQVMGGLLVQDRDHVVADRTEMEVATSRAPDEPSGATCCSPGGSASHVKSNAIVLARDGATVGIGAGQMSRVDSVRLAVEKSDPASRCRARCWPPTRSSRSPTARSSRSQAGVTAIIQPGGSKRDDEVVAAADEAGVAMVFTSRRHFRH